VGLTKSNIFTSGQNKTASIFKVLGHPARIAIIQHLLKINGCICGDLVEEIGLAQATISQHLKELKKIGIVKGDILGTSVCYCIDEESWYKYKELTKSFFEDFKCCGVKC
jgi:DNA-binding transcriptional ArsR family regulator